MDGASVTIVVVVLGAIVGVEADDAASRLVGEDVGENSSLSSLVELPPTFVDDDDEPAVVEAAAAAA